MAEKQILQARRALNADLYEFAARESYLAALSAARAIIFEKTGNAPKTHSGARSELARLRYEGLEVGETFLSYLATGFEMKSDLDYGPVTPVQRQEAEQAFATAHSCVAAAKAILSDLK
ncbi:MAG TPA: HEPN domain-containing protein [Rhizomicrobium sp.]